MNEYITKKIARNYTHKGSFRLSNGSTSQYYFDIRQFAMTHTGHHMISEAISDLLYDKILNCNSAGGMETGAIPIVMSLVENWHIDGFFVRKRIKNYGLLNEIEGTVHGKVLVVEDVISTGSAVMKVIETLKGQDIIGVLCVMTRDSLGGVDKIKATGIQLFTMTNEEQVLKAFNEL